MKSKRTFFTVLLTVIILIIYVSSVFYVRDNHSYIYEDSSIITFVFASTYLFILAAIVGLLPKWIYSKLS